MLWEENNRKKNEENILKLILEKKKKLKKITSSFRIISYFFKSALTPAVKIWKFYGLSAPGQAWNEGTYGVILDTETH
jgi:hypothetical protein